jgi:tetratricopeptide (TPR) repeat protein
MGSPSFFWMVTAAFIPVVAPIALRAQTAGSNANVPGRPGNVVELVPKKLPKRGRSRSVETQEDHWATNDWNSHYLTGKEYYLQGKYDKALAELTQNLADCDRIDFESLRKQNGYFEHILNSIPSLGQDPRAFIRSSNQQWVGAVLSVQGQYDQAATRFTEMEIYAQKCFPGRMSTFEGCSSQAMAFVLAARGQYDEAALRYRAALAHIEGNQAQIGLPPAPCVVMILTGLADVELARGRLGAAEQCLRRAERVQEAQRQLGIGPAPLDRAALMVVLAQLRRTQERESESFDLYADSLAIVAKIRKDHPLSAYSLDGLAEVDLKHGRLDQSEGHFRESLAVRQASLGKNHREVAYSLDGLARVAAAKGHDDDAERFSGEAFAILNKQLGPSHPDVTSLIPQPDQRTVPDRDNDRNHRARPRFLAIPTLITVGWQVLHMGRDWRAIEANILWRDVKEAKTGHHVSAPSVRGATAASQR